MSPRRIAAAILCAATLTLTAAGCARSSNGTLDAPLGRQDNSPAQIINAPDGWRNVMTKCVSFQPGKRIYEVRGTDAVPVIVDDPACGKAGH
ncbi:hypothetical protein MXD61_23215 [Frankia sp. AgPm24]|uniref:hypothetical protein n=1 Tax=Frankia TaxID=1854 RepID=UPI0013D51E80|nr:MULTISPECIES: hypothetical protein [Frankia]MCK9924738.1 hypothetical protein [Frankia sp. AgPm24]